MSAITLLSILSVSTPVFTKEYTKQKANFDVFSSGTVVDFKNNYSYNFNKELMSTSIGDVSVNYSYTADGYYMFTCIITDIPVKDVGQSVTAYAYICVEDKWYFYNAETTTVFKDLYDANYLQAAKVYGW